ncbi:MAG: pitrilysin family protein [Saprospiraceae bacterium]
MIQFEKHTLSNGLRVVINRDATTALCAVNIVYNVGSKLENPMKTGFAHLFEHLMFGGTKAIPSFDLPLQFAGGDNNASTNSDLTNYYDILPAQNIETAFWLESDRMRELDFSEKSLKVQKKVVIEEFRETCLEEPYGDVWHHLGQMAYKTHPYKWPTIGQEISHIKEITLLDVKDFFYTYYRPNNAVLSISGNVDVDKTMRLVENYFGEIPRGKDNSNTIPSEPKQSTFNEKILYANVPHDAIFRAYHMDSRYADQFYAADFISDILASGRSSRFYKRLFKEKQMFNIIDAFVSGTIDPGLIVLEGHLNPGVDMDTARNAIMLEIEILKQDGITDQELQKLKNTVETSIAFSEVNILNKAISLGYYEITAEANLINTEIEKYFKLTKEDIQQTAQELFTDENCNELCYLKIT